MKTPNLNKLSQYRDKRVRIDLAEGGHIVAIPQQWLEEDYPSYLVDIVETNEWGYAGNLRELTEKEIRDVEPLQ